MSYTRKYSKTHQKINGTSTPMTVNADISKIEVPINKLIKRYVQQACISNLLVTVFAARHQDKSQMIDNFKTPNNFIYGGQPAKN